MAAENTDGMLWELLFRKTMLQVSIQVQQFFCQSCNDELFPSTCLETLTTSYICDTLTPSG
jgi:hypothetical protein